MSEASCNDDLRESVQSATARLRHWDSIDKPLQEQCARVSARPPQIPEPGQTPSPIRHTQKPWLANNLPQSYLS